MADSHGCFVWYELMTTDMEAARAFYAEVMDWGTQDASTPGMAYTLFKVGDASVSGLMNLPEEARTMGAQPRWLGYVGVNDVDAAVSQIKRLNGVVHVPPTDIPDLCRFSVVADPQMATLALVKWQHPGQELSQQPDQKEQRAEPREPGRVGWHELFAVDGNKAFAFYGEFFGWRKAGAEAGPTGTYQLFSAGGQTIGGMFTKPPTVPVPFWL
jgi:uncharacterized protein